MTTLVVPGQGRIPADFLSCDFEEKSLYFSKVCESLDISDLEQNASDHVVNSALIVASACANYSYFKRIGGAASATAGYSVGQLGALAIAGVLEPDDAILLATKRARIMKERTVASTGMLAVLGLLEPVVEQLVREVASENAGSGFVEISNYNSDGNLTVAGTLDLLSLVGERATACGARKVVPLAVEGAWHSSMLLPAADDFRAELNKMTFAAPQIAFFDNVTGKEEANPSIIKENLVFHLFSAVRWNQITKGLVAINEFNWLECGGGNQLAEIAFFADRRITCKRMNSRAEIEKCVALSV